MAAEKKIFSQIPQDIDVKHNRNLKDTDLFSIDGPCNAYIDRYQLQNIVQEDFIARGSYGSVYKVTAQTPKGTILRFALKVFVLDGSSQQRNKNVTETIFLEKLQGTRAVPRLIANWSCACEKLPNLVQNKLLQHKGIQSKKICRYILMEYCDGDLHSLLETEPANRHLNFFAGMTALAQIGKAKCLHNDISFRHIMYQGIKLVERKFVVVDFGYAQEIIPNKAKRYYANVYANIPTSYVYDYDPLLNKWFAEDSYAQLFAIFHNLFPLLIEFRKDRYRKMSFPREGKDYYFNGFVLDVYAEPVRQWTNAVNLLNADKPLLIVEDFGHSENNSFRIKFSKFLEAASFVAEI